MPYAVILYFDPLSEARLAAFEREVESRSIQTAAQAYGVRPHISLASFETVTLQPFLEALEAFAGAWPAPEVVLASLGTFPTEERVVYLAPVATRSLLSLHADFFKRTAVFADGPNRYYLPGAWVPHCTLAIQVDDAGFATLAAASRGREVFGPSRLEQVALVEYFPVSTLQVFPFKGVTGSTAAGVNSEA